MVRYYHGFWETGVVGSCVYVITYIFIFHLNWFSVRLLKFMNLWWSNGGNWEVGQGAYNLFVQYL